MNANDEAKAWAGWVDSLVDRNWQAWMTTFMFKELHASERATIAIMNREVQAFYRKFLTRLARKPNGIAGKLTRPILIGCPDFPVHKRKKRTGRLSLTNGGAHFGALMLFPYAALTSSSRLKVPFDEHVEAKKLTYCGPSTNIDRIHLEEISYTPEQAAAYVTKALTNYRIESDDILLLPRSLSEI